jgi:hypothetical protein
LSFGNLNYHRVRFSFTDVCCVEYECLGFFTVGQLWDISDPSSLEWDSIDVFDEFGSECEFMTTGNGLFDPLELFRNVNHVCLTGSEMHRGNECLGYVWQRNTLADLYGELEVSHCCLWMSK